MSFVRKSKFEIPISVGEELESARPELIPLLFQKSCHSRNFEKNVVWMVSFKKVTKCISRMWTSFSFDHYDFCVLC